MSRTLVTGGAGFIGSHLVARLVETGNRVTVVDNLSTGKVQNVHPKAKLAKMDIRSPRLQRLFKRVRPITVFHFAAHLNLHASLQDPVVDAQENIFGSLNVLESSRQSGVRTFLFASTGGALYGDGVRIPTPESVVPLPLSPYGIAKYTVEQYVNFYGREFHIRTVSLRLANVYGPRQNQTGQGGVVAIFFKNLLRGQPLLINGNGRQTRDFIYVDDVVNATMMMIKTKISVVWNIGTGIETSVNSLARRMMHVSDRKSTIIYRPSIRGEVQRSALSSKALYRKLKWRPTVELGEGLRETLRRIQTDLQ